MVVTKTCLRCNIEKPSEEFSVLKNGKFGLNSWCKRCHREYAKSRRDDPKFLEKLREYNVLEWATRPQADKEEVNARRRSRYPDKKEEINEKNRANRKANPEIGKKQNEKKMARYRSDLDFRIKENLRSRLRQALVGEQKAGSAIKDLGCSISELRLHLESKFQEGMTWENRGVGKGKWNIDHIIPLSAFKLSERQHVVLACNYLNLQPLWTEDNVSKGNRY